MLQILVAEDDPVMHALLMHSLSGFGYEIIECGNGVEALKELKNAEGPIIGILDWVMPELNGPQVCQSLKTSEGASLTYLILVTSKRSRADIIEGFEAGADDYITKPFDLQELHARVHVGVRVLSLQETFKERVQRLEQALAEVQQLQGLLPICSYCKKIRNDENYWQQVEEYLSHRIDIQFSHGVCPHCFEKEIVPQLKAIKARKSSSFILPS
ncbi:MAG: hypothetical protein NPIRA02_33010 [Nitrospirales bacterium]|nr:MAG: hypothetical protein NPIRA02_33010 [Nitrospirales bacterium]